MKRNIIKLRAMCYFGSDRAGFGYIRYDDETPDETRVWKTTRRHNDGSIVEIGQIWSNEIEDMSEPCWNAYAILDGGASREEILEKAGELHAAVAEWMRRDAGKFLERVEGLSFDPGNVGRLVDEYEGK